jgi:hypothetical protein
MELGRHQQPLPPATMRFVMATAAAKAFIHRHSDHVHDDAGGACSVCIQLTIARYMLNSLSCIALALIATFLAETKKPALVQFFCFASPVTLISLKVQFNT